MKSKEISRLNDNYFSSLQEAVLGIREVKSLGLINSKHKQFSELIIQIKDANIKMGIINSLLQLLVQCVNFIAQISVIAVGGILLFNNMLSMDYFIAFGSYSEQFSMSLMNVANFSSNFQSALTSLERSFNLLDNMSFSEKSYGNKIISNNSLEINFQNVIFQYKESTTVLNDISFNIPQNKKIALVGPSGSGKTTIFNLLLRFYEPISGNITINNTNLNEIDESSLSAAISIVHQEPFLFNMSIKENLLLANPIVNDQDIVKACKTAFIHDFIMSLKDSYDTRVGENGVCLSVGQKQRIAIARALLKKSKLILLDEATSALDNESQYGIKKAIDELSNIATVIIITHRLSTIIDTDEIIVIEKGEIIGQGNHRWLLDNNSLYRRYYNTELRPVELNNKEVEVS